MKEYRVYTKRLAEYLSSQGFEILKIVPCVTNPKFKNWIFEDTQELQTAISIYTASLHKNVIE